MTAREKIQRMPRRELMMLINSRNDEQTDKTRADWLAWVDAQAHPPKSWRQAWYGFRSHQQAHPGGTA